MLLLDTIKVILFDFYSSTSLSDEQNNGELECQKMGLSLAVIDNDDLKVSLQELVSTSTFIQPYFFWKWDESSAYNF